MRLKLKERTRKLFAVERGPERRKTLISKGEIAHFPRRDISGKQRENRGTHPS